MNNSREKFYKAMHKKYAWNNCEDILANHDSYSERVFLCVYYSWEAWQAATEQSQKEIEALQAREKVLVDLLGECVDTVRNEYNEMLELYSIYPHKQYDIQCQKELLNGIEQALANVRGE